MFKLESYITPIILSYVDKYVKNARAERSQVSLWGGDVVFSNLDLRLDVLERELGLPFSFVSGHIHELHINVPWTRLNTEPIVITINTIECVLRLPDSAAKSTSSHDGSAASVKSNLERKKSRRQLMQTEAPPPGYVQSLINKIISNVKIVCNNLILKYVEEDIVLSLNTRWLCLTSANAIWEPSFVELSLPDLVLRKLLQVKDMTVCLDKRDASGRIENYQEPLLYRCSLSVHAAWIYDSINSKVPRTTRYEIRSTQMHFSLTDTQLPMFLRIVSLFLALYYGDIQDQADGVGDKKTQVSINMPMNDDNLSDPDRNMTGGSASWSGWAWNVGATVGSALLPIYWEDDDDDDAYEDFPSRVPFDPLKDKTVHLALYVDSAALVFKLTENLPKDLKTSVTTASSGSFLHSTRLAFTPFLRLDVSGFFQEIKSVGVHTVNVRIGLSGMDLSPVGVCTCGESDVPILDQDNAAKPDVEYLKAGDHAKKSFLKGSLFEKDYGDEQGTCKERKCSYNIEWEHHLETCTEDALLERTPAVALDLLYNLELPDDIDSEQLSVVSDLENSNLGEKAICRVVFGPCQARMCSGSFHRFNTISHYLSKYDYPPYKKAVEEEEDLTMHHPKDMQIDASVVGRKIRIYQLTAISPSLSIFAADHLNLSSSACLSRRAHRVANNASSSSVAFSPYTEVPFCLITLDCFDSQAIVPMYPKKIASLAHQLEDASLMKHCATSVAVKMIQLQSRLCVKDQGITWAQPSNIQLSARTQKPDKFFDDNYAVNFDFTFDLQACKIRLSRPQWLLLVHIGSTWFEKSESPPSQPTTLQDAMTKKLPSLVGFFAGLHFNVLRSKKALTIASHCSEVSVAMSNISPSNLPLLSTISSSPHLTPTKTMTVPVSPGRAQNKRSDEKNAQHWLRLDMQVPLSHLSAKEILSLLSLQIGEVHVNFDPKLADWLLYVPQQITKPKATATAASNLSVKPDDSGNKSLTVPSCTGSRTKARSKSPKTEPMLRREKTPSGVMTKDSSTMNIVKDVDKQSESSSPVLLEVVLRLFNDWFNTMNALLIQVQIDAVHLYAPRKSLVYLINKPARHVKDAISACSKCQIIAITAPSIVLENVTHKPMIQQFLSRRPYCMPESVWNSQRDNLPWTLKLKNFSIFSINAEGETVMVLEPISTSCTVGLNCKGTGYAICVHADMSGLKATITDDQLAQFVSLIERVAHIVSKLYPNYCGDGCLPPRTSIAPTSGNYVVKMRGISSMSTHSFEQNSQRRRSSSDQSKSDHFKLKQDSESKLSLWLQWTLPQATLSLVTTKNEKLQLSMEDCQSSFDWSPVYFQAKGRVLQASIKHFVFASQKWTEGANNGLILSFTNEITNELEIVNSKSNVVETLLNEKQFQSDKTCFSMVFTRAECKNVYTKWRELTKNRALHQLLPKTEELCDESRFINEIDVKVAPVDVILDVKSIMPFVHMMSRPVQIKLPDKCCSARGKLVSESVVGLSINNNTLPLTYLKLKTIRVFVIANKRLQSDEMPSSVFDPDVLLLNCESLMMVPQVDNPLARILIKPELYHLSMPLMDLPGALVENRQYQLDVKGVGVYSGSWSDISKKADKPARPLGLKSMSENPALEWNIAAANQARTERREKVVLMPLLSEFNLQVMLAPAMVLEQGSSRELIAGHSMEINATSDIMITASLGQLKLLSLLSQEALATLSVLKVHPAHRGDRGASQSFDSGVDCSTSGLSNSPYLIKPDIDLVREERDAKVKFVPLEVLVTGCKISANFYDVEPYVMEKDSKFPVRSPLWRKLKHSSLELGRPRLCVEEESDGSQTMVTSPRLSNKLLLDSPLDIGYEASEEGSIDDGSAARVIVTVNPLLSLSLDQPHVFVTCSPSEQKAELSCYDASASISPANYYITCSGGHHIPSSNDYTLPIFLTRPGEPNPKSGIPPSLVTLGAQNFLTKKIRLSMKLERPVKFNVSDQMANEVVGIFHKISAACGLEEIQRLLSHSPKKASERSQARQNRIADLRSTLTDLQKIDVSTKQIVLSTVLKESEESQQYGLLIGMSELKSSVTLTSCIEENVSTIDRIHCKFELSKIIARATNQKMNYRILGPWTFQSSFGCNWASGDNFPSITAQAESSSLPIFVGSQSLEVMRAFSEKYLVSQGSPKKPGKEANVSDLMITKKVKESYEQSLEQHYVDDLRAGAFHFTEKVELNLDEAKPYQIVFTSSPPAMTWIYPKPRTLTKVTVFPVPLIAADDFSDLSEHDSIGCSLQYWDQCLCSFQTYSIFVLSEQNVSHLDLPLTTDLKKLAVSQTWRILIHGSEADEDEICTPIVVKPQSLVAVVRVDSFYSPRLVPKIQTSFKFDVIKICLVNQLHHLPSLVTKPFAFNQEIATLSFESTFVGLDAWARNEAIQEFSARVKSLIQVTHVDFLMLSTHHILLPCKVQALSHCCFSDEGTQMENQVHCKKLELRCGHFAYDMVKNMSALWQPILETSRDGLTSILVVNSSLSPLRIGQADTDESILVRPNEKLHYAWRSQKARLMLRCSVESAIQPGIWKWSEPFTLRSGNISAKINHGAYINTFCISVAKTASTKYSVTINGLISTASFLKDSLEVRLILKKSYAFIGSDGGKDDVRSVLKGSSASNSHIVEPDYVGALKIRIYGIGTPWSGDIPLSVESGRKSSVLVKLPHKEKGKCLTIWSRLVLEEMDNGSKRYLIIFSPLYMVRSLLPNPLRILTSPSKSPASRTEVVLEGQDIPSPLDVFESADTKYHLSFKVDDNLPPSEPFLLSWGVIEQLRDKHYSPPSIDAIREEISRMPTTKKWPFTDDNLTVSGLNEQPKTDVQVTFNQFHPLCNTVCADVNPWCLFINRIGTTLLLKDGAGGIYSVQNDSVLVPPCLLNAPFYIGLIDETNAEHFSPPLQLTNQEWKFNSWMPSVEGMVPMEGICQSKIVLQGNHICLFTIKTKNENGIRIIEVVPTIHFTNMTEQTLSVAAMSAFGNYDTKLVNYLPQVIESNHDQYVPLLYWQVLGQTTKETPVSGSLFDGFQHLAMKAEDTFWSDLLNIEDCRSLQHDVRKSLSLPIVNQKHPANRVIFITLHQRKGQVFITAQTNQRPQFLVHNALSVPVLFAVSKSKDLVSPNQEINVAYARSSVYAATSLASIAMQKVDSNSAIVNLFLSCVDTQKSCGEENPDWELIVKEHRGNWIGINLPMNDHFSCIPGYGDVSLRAEKVAGTFEVFIEPISALEISAKDVRSRITSPQSTPGFMSLPLSPESTSDNITEESDANESGSGVSFDAGSFFTVKSPGSTMGDISLKTEYKSCYDDPKDMNSMHSIAFEQFWLSVFCEEASLVLTDDCVESYNMLDEYLRVTLDTILMSVKPRVVFTNPLKSRCGAFPLFNDVHLSIGGIQVDNQMFHKGSFDFPVLLKGQHQYSGVKHASSGILAFNLPDFTQEQVKEESLFNLFLSFDANRSKNILTEINLRVKPINVFIEDVFFYKMSEILKSFSGFENESFGDDAIRREIQIAAKCLAAPLCLEKLSVEPLHILVSVHASVKAYVGLDQSPLYFGGYTRQNIVTSTFALGQSIAKHYISGTLFRAGWVVGSLEMIGSPAGLTRAVGDGFKDFVAMPFHGIFNGPLGFATGIVHGSSSLVKHVSAGTLTSVTNFASSVSRNLDRLSLDKEHCQRNEVARRALPQGVSHGLVNGLSGIGISILGAIGGLAHHPIKSLLEDGPSPGGLVGGITRGIVGVVTKPLGGAAELVAQAGHGLLVGTGWAQDLKQREPSLPQHVCSTSSSSLKFQWKFDCGQIITLAEVTQQLDTSMVPTTLILTSDAIFIVSEEEDCQDSAFALAEIHLVPCQDDPTRLELVPIKGKKTKSDQEYATNERIVQFVMESGFHVTVSDVEEEEARVEKKKTNLARLLSWFFM